MYPSLRSRELQEQERLLASQERELEGAANSRVRMFLAAAWRPFEVLAGLALLLLSGVIFISLLLTKLVLHLDCVSLQRSEIISSTFSCLLLCSVDKAMHSFMRYGYLLPTSNRTLPNVRLRTPKWTELSTDTFSPFYQWNQNRKKSINQSING